MAATTKYSEEQLNYFRICCVTTDLLAEGLRSIFKREWDNRYRATLGEWKDEPRNGLDFYNGESPGNRRRNAHLLTTMINGNRAEWDCTKLFYAILYSDCIGHGLNPAVRANVADLRKFRNEEFAHMARGDLSDLEFQNAIGNVDVAFRGLGLCTLHIQEIRNQTSFPTEELEKVLRNVQDLKQELHEKEEQRKVLEDQLLNEVSPFCILPPKPSHDVAGRDYEVARITQQLKELKEVNESHLSYLYISGNPGSGKSQLAGLIAKRFFEDVNEIPHSAAFVMTLNADSLDSLLESYISFSRNLKCSEYAVTDTRNSKDLKTEEKIVNLKSLISTKIELYTSWLVVVDNVTNVNQVQVHLPEPGNKQWKRGQMLITTQDTASIPLPSSFIDHVAVSKGMEPRDACSVLARLSGIADSDMEINVARALDYQPLALASAATFVKRVRQSKASSNFGWYDYLDKLEKGQRGFTESILAETNPSYPQSMTVAIKLALEEVMASDKVLNHTLNFISLCAQQPLSLEIVLNYILKVNEEFTDKTMIRMRIQRSSLLLLEEGDSEDFVRVHQVVHDVTKTVTKRNTESQHLEAVHGAIKSFNQFIDESLPKNWRELDSLVSSSHMAPHLKTFIKEIKNMFRKDNTLQIIKSSMLNVKYYPNYFLKFGTICASHCDFHSAKRYSNLALELYGKGGVFGGTHVAEEGNFLLGKLHQELGDFNKAKEHHERVLAIRLQNLGPQHVDVASSYNNMVLVLRDQGDLEQAKEYHERALAILLKKLGHQHVDVATSYNNMALVLCDQGDLEQAKEYYERALAIRLQKLGPQHVDVATSYNNVAAVFHAQGDQEQAKEYHERALAILLQKLGHQHVDVATSYYNMADVFHAQGDLEQAKEYHERALAIRLQKLGPQHVDVATSYNNTAAVFHAQGDLEQAKEYHERAVAIRLQKLGPQHVDVATSYNNMAAVFHAQGDLEQAKKYHEHALAIRLQKLGPQHVDVATSYNNMAAVLRAQGDLEQAKEYYERAVAIRLQKLGPQHVDVATSYNNVAAVLHAQGDLEQVKKYHERALAIRLQKLGPQHVDVSTSYNNMAAVLYAQGDLEQAKQYLERALAIRLQKLGPQHVNVATSYNNMAVVFHAQGDLEQAKEYHEHALAILLQKLGPQHVDVATSYNNLAAVFHAQGDLEQAKEYHERAVAIRLQKLGPQHVDVATSYKNMAAVLHAQGDLEKGKEYHERALAIRLQKLGPQHVDVATSYNNMAAVLRAQGDLEQAKEYLERALAILLQKLGPQHVDVAC